MSVDGHESTSYFSSVFNCCSVDVIVSSPEQLNDPGGGEIILVDGFVFE